MIDTLLKYPASVATRVALAALPAPVVDSMAYCQETNTLYRFAVGLTSSPDGRRVISPTQSGDENAGRWVEINPGTYAGTQTALPGATGVTEETTIIDVTELIAGGVYGIYVGVQAHFETESSWAYVTHDVVCRNGNWVVVGTPSDAIGGPAIGTAPSFDVGFSVVGGRTYVSASCTYEPTVATYEAYPVYAAMSFEVRLW